MTTSNYTIRPETSVFYDGRYSVFDNVERVAPDKVIKCRFMPSLADCRLNKSDIRSPDFGINNLICYQGTCQEEFCFKLPSVISYVLWELK